MKLKKILAVTSVKGESKEDQFMSVWFAHNIFTSVVIASKKNSWVVTVTGLIL